MHGRAAGDHLGQERDPRQPPNSGATTRSASLSASAEHSASHFVCASPSTSRQQDIRRPPRVPVILLFPGGPGFAGLC
jgi:hypothetical protein